MAIFSGFLLLFSIFVNSLDDVDPRVNIIITATVLNNPIYFVIVITVLFLRIWRIVLRVFAIREVSHPYNLILSTPVLHYEFKVFFRHVSILKLPDSMMQAVWLFSVHNTQVILLWKEVQELLPQVAVRAVIYLVSLIRNIFHIVKFKPILPLWAFI